GLGYPGMVNPPGYNPPGVGPFNPPGYNPPGMGYGFGFGFPGMINPPGYNPPGFGPFNPPGDHPPGAYWSTKPSRNWRDGGRQEGDTVLVATIRLVIVVGEPFPIVENDGPLRLGPGAQLTRRKEVEDVARVRIDERVGLHLRQRARYRVSMGRIGGGEGL